MPRSSAQRIENQFPELAPVIAALETLNRENGRYAFLPYLTEVYRVGRSWSRQRNRKRRTRELVHVANLKERRDLHAFRAIIETTFPSLEAKMASRWTRALEFARLEKVHPAKLSNYFRKKGGVARCARQAALELPKRRYRRPTWD